MLERMQNVLKNRKAKGDKGFSLVELAVVIVIIGILVAIAIPVFNGITRGAEQSNVDAAAANGAAIIAGNIASGATVAGTGVGQISEGLPDLVNENVASVTNTGGNTISTYCVTATPVAGKGNGPATKGPGCP